MKGSTKIVLGALVLILLLGGVVTAKDEYSIAIPIVKIVKIGHTVVRYDGISYHFSSPVALNVTLDKVDDTHVELYIKTVDTYIPTMTVGLWWDDFPINSLELDMGGENSWTLDTETGYAEK
jgi:hypothetical protein